MRPLLFALVLLLCTAISALAGNELGNGGDLVSQEFIAAGRKLVEELRAKPDSRIPDLERLATAVEKVKVTSSGHLTLHGAEVDAINYPEEQEIDVNRPRWEVSNPEKRASLVLHEYLGVIQVPDLHYEISGSYAAPFAAPEEKPKKFEVGVGTAYGWENPGKAWHHGSTSPGISLHAGYAMSQRSELLFQVDRQSFGSNDFGDSFAQRYSEATLGYRHWLNDSRTLRPFVQANAGYSWSRWDDTMVDPERTYEEWHYQSADDGNFALQLGAGVRYSLLRDIGLDLGASFHSVGPPWKWLGYDDKLLTFNAGMSVVF